MLSVDLVPARHILLGVVAACVLVAGIYLFIEVKSTTAAPAKPVPVAHTEEPPAQDDHPSARAGDHRWNSPRVGAALNNPPPPPVVNASGDADEPSTDDMIAQVDKPNPKLDAIMDQANKHYDRGEWEDAKAIAGKVLSKQPTNIRMMRIMVSSSCVDGDQPVAQKWFDQLPKADREQMKVRCAKYQVTFKEPAQ